MAGPSGFDNPNCSVLIENKQNEESDEHNRMNNELNLPVTNNVEQDIEDRKLSLAIIHEKVKQLNSVECMLLYMHLPQYACSDGSVESNFTLLRNTLIRNSFVALVSDAMKGVVATIAEEIKCLPHDVDIIEEQIFKTAGVVRGNIFNNLNLNQSVQNVIAWCKLNYKQKLDSLSTKSDMHNSYISHCTAKNIPSMSPLLFGKLVLIIFPSAAVTKSFKGVLQYKNLCKLENVGQRSEVDMDAIGAQFTCKQFFDIYDQILNHVSRKVAKTQMGNREESAKNNVTVTLNNDNENDSYRSGELDGCTVLVHDPLSLLNLSASSATVNENRKKTNNLKSKSTNVNNGNGLATCDSLDNLTTQKLADIIGCRLEVVDSRDVFQRKLKSYTSKGRKFKEYKHPSVKKISAEYPRIKLSNDLTQTNLAPDITIGESEIFDWYAKRFHNLQVKLSQMTSSQIPGKGMHKLHCGCCNINFEVGDAYVQGLDILRRKFSKLKIVFGKPTKIYVERDPNEIIEIEDEETIEEPTPIIPEPQNHVSVITKTQPLVISSNISNIQDVTAGSSGEILPEPPITVPEVITKPLTIPHIVSKHPIITSKTVTKPLPKIVTEPPVILPRTVTKPPEILSQIVSDPPVTLSQFVSDPPQVIAEPVPITLSQIMSRHYYESPQSGVSNTQKSPQIVTKSPEVPSEIGHAPSPPASPQITTESPAEPLQTSNKPRILSQIITKPSKIAAEPPSFTKPTTVSSQVMKPKDVAKARKAVCLQLKKPNSAKRTPPVIAKPTSKPNSAKITPPIIAKPTSKASSPTNLTPVTPSTPATPNSSETTEVPPMVYLADLLKHDNPVQVRNVTVSSMNPSKSTTNKQKSTTKHVDDINKTIKLDKDLEGIPKMSKNIAGVSSSTQHISVQSLNHKYKKIVIPKTVMHSDIAPVVVLNSEEVCDWYIEKMNSLKRLVRKYRKRSHKSTSTTSTTITTDTSLALPISANHPLTFRRSRARLMNFCESDSDGDTASTSRPPVATLADLLDKPTDSYISQVTLKRARMEKLDERGNKRRKIFREHKVISSEKSIDKNLIDISDDIATIADDNNVHTCAFCLKTFVGLAQFLYHCKTHLHCKTCKKRFRNVDSMMTHLRNHCVVNARKSTPCLKLKRVDAVVNAKTSRNNSITVPTNKEVRGNSILKNNVPPKTIANGIHLKELLSSPGNVIQRMMSTRLPPKLVPTSRTSHTASVPVNVNNVQRPTVTNTSHGSVNNVQWPTVTNTSHGSVNNVQRPTVTNTSHGSVYFSPSGVPISTQAFSMPSLQPPPLITTSVSSKTNQIQLSNNQISKSPQNYMANQIQLLQPVIQQQQHQQQNAQPVQLKNAINNNYNKIFLLNNMQGGNFMSAGGQVLINNENTYLVTSGNQPFINAPISTSYNIAPNFNIVSTVPSPVITSLNIAPSGLEDHSYHQQRVPIQDENVDVVNQNNSALQPTVNNSVGGGFKLRVKSLHELR